MTCKGSQHALHAKFLLSLREPGSGQVHALTGGFESYLHNLELQLALSLAPALGERACPLLNVAHP